MDSFLSGFSHNYGGTQIGREYPGNVSVAGNAGSGSAQGVDVTQLQPGDTFQGEIVSVNGEDVQIQLTNGQYMAAKLERDVQVAIGQVMNLQVQSNRDHRVVLKPVYDGRAQMLRVGEAALRAAHMAVSDKNLTLVSKLIENGLSIDKNTLMTFNRLALQNPSASMADIIKLNKMQLPVSDSNLTQLQNYRNMEHRLLDGIREASDEILRLYDTLTGNQGTREGEAFQGGQNLSGNRGLPADGRAGEMQGSAAGQAALENGGKFMERVIALLAGEEGQAGGTGAGSHVADGQDVRAGSNPDNPAAPEGKAQEQPLQEGADRQVSGKGDAEILSGQGKTAGNENAGTADTHSAVPGNRADTVLNQLKGEPPQTLPDKIIAFIKEGKLDIREMKQLLTDSDLGRQLTTGQKSVIFRSEPFKSMLKNGLQRQWTLTPQELAREGRVEEFYQKLVRESSQLSRMMNEAMQSGGQNLNGAQGRAMGNISENVEFMNQMNQMFNYVQLPLKLGNSQAHGDLYVYTNKKNMARRDGMLTAFLHLDMDNLGALDVSIALQTGKNQVTTKFYLDEDVIPLVEAHIGELTQRLSQKGYRCKNMVLEKEEDKTVMEHIEEQAAGGNAILSYQTFDIKA